MNRRVWTMVGVAAAIVGGGVPATGALAQSALSAPSRLSTVRIAIPRGQVCFRHEGAATHLAGNFRRGQRIVATSTGDAMNGEGRSEWTTTQARGVYVNWGGDDDQFAFEGGEPWVAPVTGRYTFSYSPTALLGGRGVFIVCAF